MIHYFSPKFEKRNSHNAEIMRKYIKRKSEINPLKDLKDLI